MTPPALNRFANLLPPALRARLESSPTLRRLIPNTGWLLADRLLRMSVSLFVTALVARYLAPDAYGRLNFAIAFVSLFSAFGTLGLERIAVRELVLDREHAGDILGSTFVLRLAGSVVGCGLAVAAISALRPGDRDTLAMVALMSGVMVVQALDVIDYWNQSRMRARLSVLSMSVGFVIAATARIILVARHAPLLAFAWVWAAELALGSLGIAITYVTLRAPGFRWRAVGSRLRTLLRDGWPILLSGIAVMTYTRIDQVMLGQMSSAHELGIYSAAVKLVEVSYFLPTAIAISVFPSVLEARRAGDTAFFQRLQKLYDLMATLGYAIAVPTTLLAPWLVPFLFGRAFAPAIPQVMLLVWSVVFTNLGIARGLFLTAMNWNWAYFMTVAVGCVVNIGLNLVLIPRWGGMGAVIASCVTYWVAAHGTCFLYPPLFPTGAMLTRALWPWRR